MTATPAPPVDVDQLAAEYLDLKTRAGVLDDRMKQIVAQLRDLGPGKHDAGNYAITVTPSRRFDPDLARIVLASNPELLAACTDHVISSTKAKQVLAPAVYESLMTPSGDPRVNVRGA